MNVETYEFPGWDRCMRCLCHTSDVCPDLEYLYSLQEEDVWWNGLSEVERAEYLEAGIEIKVEVIERPNEDWLF